MFGNQSLPGPQVTLPTFAEFCSYLKSRQRFCIYSTLTNDPLVKYLNLVERPKVNHNIKINVNNVNQEKQNEQEKQSQKQPQGVEIEKHSSFSSFSSSPHQTNEITQTNEYHNNNNNNNDNENSNNDNTNENILLSSPHIQPSIHNDFHGAFQDYLSSQQLRSQFTTNKGFFSLLFLSPLILSF